MSTEIGLKIELLQAEQNLSNVELAKKLGIYPQNVPRLKRVKDLRATTIHKLSRAFDVPVSYFFDAA